ncbi:hypothetical protein [Bacteroides cellulosilyticus]|uniref:hypothetical protein n=1 Tax=Bacteroides cellulosilyticus TaxID=246787 RepID=UPI0032BF880B
MPSPPSSMPGRSSVRQALSRGRQAASNSRATGRRHIAGSKAAGRIAVNRATGCITINNLFRKVLNRCFVLISWFVFTLFPLSVRTGHLYGWGARKRCFNMRPGKRKASRHPAARRGAGGWRDAGNKVAFT